MNHPDYGTERYNDYFVNQLTELLTNYGEVAEVWFDGACGEGPNGKKQVYDFTRYYETIRKLQPQAVIAVIGPDVRWVGTESGYGRDTEWSVIPASENMLAKIAASSQQKAGGGTFVPEGSRMAKNLGSRKKLAEAKVNVKKLTDRKLKTYWSDDSKVLTLSFEEAQLLDRILLQENITEGQRVEMFVVEYWDENGWNLWPEERR